MKLHPPFISKLKLCPHNYGLNNKLVPKNSQCRPHKVHYTQWAVWSDPNWPKKEKHTVAHLQFTHTQKIKIWTSFLKIPLNKRVQLGFIGFKPNSLFLSPLSSTETLDLVRRRRPKNAVDPDSDLLKTELFTIWVLFNFEVFVFG